MPWPESLPNLQISCHINHVVLHVRKIYVHDLRDPPEGRSPTHQVWKHTPLHKTYFCVIVRQYAEDALSTHKQWLLLGCQLCKGSRMSLKSLCHQMRGCESPLHFRASTLKGWKCTKIACGNGQTSLVRGALGGTNA